MLPGFFFWFFFGHLRLFEKHKFQPAVCQQISQWGSSTPGPSQDHHSMTEKEAKNKKGKLQLQGIW